MKYILLILMGLLTGCAATDYTEGMMVEVSFDMELPSCEWEVSIGTKKDIVPID